MYYCGWDGGGSSTKVLALDESGSVIRENVFGPMNPNGASREIVQKTISDAVQWMALLPGGLDACKGLIAGMAGISNLHAADFVENAVRSTGYPGPFRLLGDHEIALAGAIRGHGAILIAGTGAVCYGRDPAGNPFRTGGYGYLIDDGGSGYALGRGILAAVVRAFDGRGPATCLTELTFQALQICDISSLITWLYSPGTGKKDIGALAPLLLQALEKQDQAALAIAESAVLDLSELAVASWRKIGMTGGELAFFGSIFQYYEVIKTGVAKRLRKELPGVSVIEPRFPAARGAAMLAKKLFGGIA
ncbi:MAG: ATPase [Clostridia bacterium]|nr:ATPase [Clostridia bacterium]